MIRPRALMLIARREITERLRSRAFRVISAVLVIGVLAAVVGGARLPGLLEADPRVLGITGEADAPGVTNAIEATARQLDVDLEIRSVADRGGGEQALHAGEIDALLIDRDLLLFESEVDATVAAVVNQALQIESLPRRLDALGLSMEDARRLLDPPNVATASLDEPAARDDGGAGVPGAAERGLAAAAVALLYVALALYGNWVLMGVVEEKANRVVEVLLGALRPTELLVGKVIGILTVAMLQAAAAAAALIAALVVVGDVDVPSAAPGVFAVSIVWFLLGLLFYNFAYAAMGATVSRQADAAGAAWPVIMLLLLPYMLGLVYVPEHPDVLVSRVLSLVPVTAPLIMPARLASGDPALWELVLGPLLMLPSIAAMAWLAGRIYAGAILQTGRRVNLLRALRSSREAA